MRGVINGKTQANDKLYDDNVVHGEVPIENETEKEQVDEDDSQNDQDRDGERASDENNHHEDGANRQADTEGSFFGEHNVLLHAKQILRVEIGVSDLIFISDGANIFQVRRAILGNRFDILRLDSLFPTLNRIVSASSDVLSQHLAFFSDRESRQTRVEFALRNGSYHIRCRPVSSTVA